MKIFAHRGASAYKPENTMDSFKLAIEQGADGIEFDLIQHPKNHYVIHDRFLERTTSGHGDILKHNASYIDQCDAGAGQKIPTLDSILPLASSGTLLNIEVKFLSDVDRFIEVIKQAIQSNKMLLDQMIISSFHHGWLSEIQSKIISLKVAYLISHYPQDASSYFAQLPSDQINVALDVLDSKLVQTAHSMNKKLWVYTVNDEADILKCLDSGVDGIFTDVPDVAIKTIRN